MNLPAGTERLRSLNMLMSGRDGYEKETFVSEISPLRGEAGMYPPLTGISGCLCINSNRRLDDPRPAREDNSFDYTTLWYKGHLPRHLNKIYLKDPHFLE